MAILTGQDEMIKIRTHHSLTKNYFYLIEKSVLCFFFFGVNIYPSSADDMVIEQVMWALLISIVGK